jgi:hypothetical protein
MIYEVYCTSEHYDLCEWIGNFEALTEDDAIEQAKQYYEICAFDSVFSADPAEIQFPLGVA